MSYASKFCAISTNGVIDVHATDVTGNYATLCGLDGDDSHPDVQQKKVPMPRGGMISCPQCEAVIEHCRRYRVTWRKP